MEALEQALLHGSKTPLMWLQEICVKQGCPMPNYVERDMRSCASDPPMFEITASVFKFQGKDYTEKGVARNKKEAKQKSAVKVLHAMGINPKDISEIKSNKTSANPYRIVDESVDATVNAAPPKNCESPLVDDLIKKFDSTEISVTSVSELNDLCEKRNLPSADYELIKDEGPPHNKTFHMKCIIKSNGDEYVTIGIENQKQKAKRKAAMIMLDKLRGIKHSEESLRDLVSRAINRDNDRSSRAPCNNRQNCNQLISHAQHRFQCFSGPAIRRLNEDEDINLDEKLLDEIKTEDNFEVEYIDASLPGQGALVQYYCVLTYSQSGPGSVGSNPSVFVGTGGSSAIARGESSRKALLFLREMTRP